MSDRNFVFVSDLHLSEGYLKDDKSYHVNEDFFYDDSFRRFLSYLEKLKATHGYRQPWRLVINGDFLDFLQVRTCPRPSCEEEVAAYRAVLAEAYGGEYDGQGFPIHKKETKLGLGFDAPKSVWKLHRIMEGHPSFFEGLAEFLLAGNDVVIVKGNHDAEFTYAEVREYFKRRIDELAEGLSPRAGAATKKRRPPEPPSSRVFFSMWFYYEPKLFYAEHGGQYDDSNRYIFFLDPTMHVARGKVRTLRFPFGSFFVRYCFNQIEGRVPFADNVRPRIKVFFWILWHKTTYFFIFLRYGWRLISEVVGKKVFSRFDLAAFLDLLAARKSFFAPLFRILLAYTPLRILWKPDPESYEHYKLRNFWLMLNAVNTDGLVREPGAKREGAGPSAAALSKIYNRSFREGVIDEETEAEIDRLLQEMTTGKQPDTKEKNVARMRAIVDLLAQVSAAAKRKPIVEGFLLTAALVSVYIGIFGGALAYGIVRTVDTPALAVAVSLGIVALAGIVAYAFRDLGKELKRKFLDLEPERYLNAAAAGVARILDVPSVVFGHTHVAYTRPIKKAGAGRRGPAKKWEYNTGSWTPVFDEQMMLRQSGDEFPFIQLVTEGTSPDKPELLTWNDELGQPERVRYTRQSSSSPLYHSTGARPARSANQAARSR